MKPLLATEADIERLRFPLLASPKLDGIRCIIHPELGAVSRTLKSIPNWALLQELNKLPPYLDGELLCGSPKAADAMRNTTSTVMSIDAVHSLVQYYVFDHYENQDTAFELRLEKAHKLVQGIALCVPVVHTLLSNIAELHAYEDQCVQLGYEGIMLRDPQGKYKFGRSSVKEGILLKVKRFSDMEGVVVGFQELMHNGNEAQRDALGRTKRSASKEGKVPTGMLGSLTLKIAGFAEDTVDVGTGFDEEQRKEIWKNRKDYEGKLVTFKYQPTGAKDRPRFPVFKGWRQDL